MIELTQEQRQALAAEDPPRVVDPQTNEVFVLVPADMYERLRGLFDDMPDASALVNEVMAEDDAEDPLLESYQLNQKESP